ncbi:MAG: two-component system, OmpR family, sensor histidine kinase BaeS [Candidatus Magnetoglobus multicellularis str. Araruama]|uniref:histidine kinase n=1 Tax=Candidatus Magnetoglobus multicellularis str. Araruama TaxID=890399 RepID=A0A1V1P4U0_9BACT|nr:MAG: two-component system, OmpR family, sensor histidine kinase BaeS [Candidatus Magnetoglobus multicellularis str. Araruama]
MRIKTKFFFLFIINDILILCFMAIVLYIFLYRNFREYINIVELNKLDHLVYALKDVYSVNNNWDLLRNQPNKWHEIIFLSLGKGRPKNIHDSHLVKIFTEKNYIPKPPELHKDGKVMFLPADPLRLGDRLFLLDKQKHYIAGNHPQKEKKTIRKITHNHETIGYIGLNVPTLSKYHHPLSIDYAKTQINALICIVCGLFMIAVLLSYFISRQLLKPVEQLSKGTESMKSFQFGNKIDVLSDDEFGQLAIDFNQMSETLKTYETMRKQWISDISHELRTPITIIRSKIEAVIDGIHECTDETMVSLKKDIIQLGKLVDDLHMLSLADSQQLFMKKELLSPRTILFESIASFKNLLDRHHMQLHTYLDDIENMFIEADRSQLIRLFNNLVDNSIKYTNAGGKINITGSCAQTILSIHIEDSSPDVSDNAMNHLFDRLYREDESRSQIKGSGLGLSICKEIVRAHEGNIQATRSLLGGLKITIQFKVKGA